MSDEIDREITTKKVTSRSNTPVNGYEVSEQRTSNVSDGNGANGLILGVLLALAVGGGAIAYFMNNRPVPAQILVPGATNTVKENKSTVIERNNTTTKETNPATPQPTPTVDVNIPVTITQPPSAPVPEPRATVTVQPIVPVPAPKATTQPQATPSPSTGANN
ncbi:MAG: hypothetical protein DCF19_20170 [Pseudanabaena frigida]|uniref:Uncharacterized protein n=1 Tax=Pseudanabaena frigida TaxID=945775 RepID=A0A2W4XMH3_9CYAN|nr:MAG: hypothetical protein DCF19_20170 [Pseudanabaena frigida]